MGILGFFLGVLTSVMVYWLFVKEKNYQKWHTCVLAIIFIAWTVFTVDFVITSLLEGMPQAAAVSALIFGIGEIILFVLMRRFSKISLISFKSETKTSVSGK
ncbi:MAG TPA: hypothetical protein GXX46_04410 [Peptococcaceae bacterium]|nr:hypothetical protein [Peptococcaceae bacterium]